MRDFLQDLPSFEAKYREKDRGDSPLATGYFIITLLFMVYTIIETKHCRSPSLKVAATHSSFAPRNDT